LELKPIVAEQADRQKPDGIKQVAFTITRHRFKPFDHRNLSHLTTEILENAAIA
jgi:hypothetical protein